jgi:hypothetical protein
MELTKLFEQRFGSHRVKEITNPFHPDQQLLLLFLELDVPVTVLMTASLSDYRMPVLEKWIGREFNEIFFCLPAYWDFDDLENPNFSWIYTWIYKLERFVRDRNTWFGPGHTIPTANPEVAISELMQQEYFIFLDPILLEKELAPISSEGKTIHFLSIVPIFGDELDFKMGKGTQKFVRKLIQRNMDEKLDDYRKSALSSRLRFF